MTTVLHQARQWANQRCRRPSVRGDAEVLEFHIPRDMIERLRHLTFVVDTDDYYDFVDYCRAGGVNHGPPPRMVAYDVVYGPVRLWPQRLVLANCDQIVFTDPARLGAHARPVRRIRPASLSRFF